MHYPVSRLEKNFNRLLIKCENIISERQPGEWRFEQYIKDLEERLIELKKLNTCQPSKDKLAEYSRRVKFLKSIVEAEKLPSAAEKAMASQMLSPATPTNISSKVHHQTKAKYLHEMRQELLGTKDDPSQANEGLRLRESKNGLPQGDFDAVLRYHNSMQEKVADEMISLVHSLKQNSILAGHVIRKDTETLEKASVMADSRYSELKVESDRVEVYAKRTCNWCVWLLLAVVCIMFLWMIVFIRMFPKR